MKLIYLIPLVFLACNSKPKEDNKTRELPPIYIDTTQKKFPIKVTEVYPNTDERIKQKYIVCTENGIMFYTDLETNVGDTAFYDTDLHKHIDIQ